MIKIILIPLLLISVIGKAQQSEQPNIVFIFCDDLNEAGLGVFDDTQAITPYIDSLSTESAVFTNAHANAPICGPSRASVFSGILPSRSGYFGFNQTQYDWRLNEILAESTSMFRHFKQNGYNVFASGKIYHAGQDSESDFTQLFSAPFQGPYPYENRAHSDLPENFNFTDISFSPLESIPSYSEATGWFAQGEPFLFENDSVRDLMGDEMTSRYCDSVLTLLSESGSPDPFFMTLGLYSPHGPFHVPKKYFDLYPLESIDVSAYEDSVVYAAAAFGNRYNSTSNRYIELLNFESPEDDPYLYLKKYLQGYYASVSFVDDQVGAILNSIEDHGYGNNTIVIFSSDHGFHLGTKKIIKKSTLWRESTQVPFMIKGQGIPTNDFSNAISLIDLYPTLIDLAGLPQPNHTLDGKELSEIISSQNHTGTIISTPAAERLDVGEDGVTAHQHHAINLDDYKYILYSSGEDELYQKANDPSELNNLSDSLPYQPQREFLRHALESETTELSQLRPSYEKLFYGDFEQGLNGWVPSRPEDGLEIAPANELIKSNHLFLEDEGTVLIENANLSIYNEGLYELRFSSFCESQAAVLRFRFIENILDSTSTILSEDFLIDQSLEDFSYTFYIPELTGNLVLKMQILIGSGVHIDNVKIIDPQALDLSLNDCQETDDLSVDMSFSQVPKDSLKYTVDQKKFNCINAGLTKHKWYKVMPSTQIGLIVARTGPQGNPAIELWSECTADTAYICENEKTNRIEFLVVDSIATDEELLIRVGDTKNSLESLETVKSFYTNILPAEIEENLNDSVLINPLIYPNFSPDLIYFRIDGITDEDFFLETEYAYSSEGWYDLGNLDLIAGQYNIKVAYRLAPLGIEIPYGPKFELFSGPPFSGISRNAYRIYPNPASETQGSVRLVSNNAVQNELASVRLLDLSGKELFVWSVGQDVRAGIQLKLPEGLPHGLLFLKVIDAAGETTVLKLSR